MRIGRVVPLGAAVVLLGLFTGCTPDGAGPSVTPSPAEPRGDAPSPSSTESSSTESSSTGSSSNGSSSTEPDPTQATPSEVPPVAADLTVTVTDGGAVRSYHLTCVPTGGDHPRSDAACTQLNLVGPSVFASPPADQVCTMQYGGPQTAIVRGTFGVDQVDASFDRGNGCAIARWDSIDELLGRYGA